MFELGVRRLVEVYMVMRQIRTLDIAETAWNTWEMHKVLTKTWNELASLYVDINN